MPLSTMASETGLDKEMLPKMIDRLDGRVDYFEGWVIIKNFMKYQNTGSVDVQTGINRVMEEIPPKIKERIDSLRLSRDGHRTVMGQPDIPILVPEPILEPIRAENTALPEWLNKEAWGLWIQYRKEMKKKMTPLTIKQQLKLLEIHKKDHVGIIKNSIQNGWTGLFPLKNQVNSDYARAHEKRILAEADQKESEESAKTNSGIRKIQEQIRTLADNKKI